MKTNLSHNYSLPATDSPITSQDYTRLVKHLSSLPHMKVTTLGYINCGTHGTQPLLRVDYRADSDASPNEHDVLISAGIHGDEPAGIIALTTFLTAVAYENRNIRLTAFPCINLSGLFTQSRFSSSHHDLNRIVHPHSIAPEMRLIVQNLIKTQRRYSVVLDLHEDNPAVPCDFAPSAPTPTELYLYENRDASQKPLSRHLLSALREREIPVCEWQTIYTEPAENGVIQRTTRRHTRDDFETFSRTYLTEQIITTETPLGWALNERVEAQLCLISSAIGTLR